ncbi:MAG: PhzF family phenazine biosynthesis protein [Syntrophaceae bacterium]|nr:PhzF family phenazine biosynthesis protein [Syntrophaceae bacterium]
MPVPSLQKSFSFKKIDAFATATSEGNPAGAVYLNAPAEMTADEMQRIARELKGFVSEVGYVWKIDDGVYGLKYYSSEREVAFCGHATIGIAYDLIGNDPALLARETIRIVNNMGTLTVENRIEGENAVFVAAPEPVYANTRIDDGGFAEAAGIDPVDLDREKPISVVNAGLETLIVPIRRLETVLGMSPRLKELKSYCEAHSVDIVTVYSCETADKANAFRTRVFAPTFGYLEDPATGSGNAAFGCYLLKNGYWDGSSIRLEQNGDFARPNIVRLLARDDGGGMRVWFGGGAIVRIRGEYFLE